MKTSTCAACGRTMAHTHRPPAGMVCHAGRGLCKTCHSNRFRPVIHGTYSSPGWRRIEHVDAIAVERACEGDRVKLNAAERRAAVDHLTRQGASINDTARRLGLTPRTVQRIRARLREQQDVAA